jgi:D-amino-acid dehydrogenase
MIPERDDVLVLGAGVIGLSCALELLKAGRGVTVLDAGAVGGGSSHGNCGTITPSHANPLAAPGLVLQALRWMTQPDAPLYIRPRADPALAHWLWRFARRCNRRDYRASTRAKAALLIASRQQLEATIRNEGLQCEFVADGTLYVYRTARGIASAQRLASSLGEFGIRAELIDGERLQREEPALREGVAGGLHFPDDAVLRPDRYVSELARRVRERGGTIVEQCAAMGFVRSRDGRIATVRTAQGERRPVETLLACGAWTSAFARELGLRVPVQPGKGYSITFSRPSLVPTRPMVLRERSVCVTAWGSGFRLGSTMEFSGYDASLNRVRLDALTRGAGEYLREPVGALRLEEWYGWRPMTWDDLPILGRTRSIPNLTLATGHGMLGVSMSTASARLVSDLICGRQPALDPSPYAPQRFGL